MEGDRGWIHTLLEEAENERMHLMTFMHIARPSAIERLLAQGLFYNSFVLLYLLSTRTAHRVTGYFEEEANHSYTEYLAGVDNAGHHFASPSIGNANRARAQWSSTVYALVVSHRHRSVYANVPTPDVELVRLLSITREKP